MMKKVSILMPLLCFTISGFSQQTVVIKPNAAEGRDACLLSKTSYSTQNYGSSEDFIACAWTNSGEESDGRALIQFNLSQIPAGSVITSAYLNLFHNPTSLNIGHSTLSGSNACLIQRVTSFWDETTVTWNTQPSTTSTGQVIVPASVNDTQNYQNIDVTGLITYFYEHPAENYGMMLRLENEAHYRSMLFASSDHPNAALWPELVVNYTEALSLSEQDAGSISWIRYPYELAVSLVNHPAILQVDLYTVSGEKIAAYNLSGTSDSGPQFIQIPDLASGIYIVNVFSSDARIRFSQKIVVP